jgi:nucleoside-diphosphate-sugar epimerase
MSDSTDPSAPTVSPVVVVTGANGLVGSRVCAALSERGATIRAVVRRAGTAPSLPDLEEHVGDFADPDLAAQVTAGATAVVTTVHPLGGDDDAQRTVAVEGTPVIARAARDNGVTWLVHVSTAAVYDRSPSAGDVDEGSALVGDDSDVYAVTKRDTDAALAEVDGITRVLLRPPAILGVGETSIWNSVRPAQIRDDASERRAVAEKSFAWVHVDDLGRLAADVATGRVPFAEDPEDGPVEGGCTPVNVAAGTGTQRDYLGAVTEALGLEPTWEEGEAWTGDLVSDRARRWGWAPQLDLDAALAELRAGLRAEADDRG